MHEELNTELKYKLRWEKDNYEMGLAGRSKETSKPFFQYVKSCQKTKVPIGPLRDENQLLVTTPQDMANLLSVTFEKNFAREGRDDRCLPQVEEVITSIEPLVFTEGNIASAFQRLKPSSTTGPDGIPSDFLIRFQEVVIPVIVPLFNHL
jgi:hypothetical protein